MTDGQTGDCDGVAHFSRFGEVLIKLAESLLRHGKKIPRRGEPGRAEVGSGSLVPVQAPASSQEKPSTGQGRLQ